MLVLNDKTISMYCVYHDERLLEECKLNTLDNRLFSLYYTKYGHDNSLDHIQEYICEFTAQYFVLRNQIKSDYVGFCQYHRVLSVDFNEFFDKNSNACGFTWGDDSWDNFQKYRFNGFLTDDIDEFIRKRYKKNDRIYKYFITNKKKPVPFYINEIYICRWEYFEEIVGCISDFIDYIDKKYELNGDPQEWHYFVLDNFIDRKLTDGIPENETWWFEKNCRNFWRVVANWIELFEGVYFGHLTQELGLPIYEVPNNNRPESMQNNEEINNK